MDKPKEKRAEQRDPGESEQKKAVEIGLTEAPGVVVENSGKCPTCGRDAVNS